MTLEQLTPFLIALATLLTAAYKWKDIVKMVVSLALKKAMNPNDNLYQSVRDYTRDGIVFAFQKMLKKYQFVDFFLILRLDKNGQYWISQEECVANDGVDNLPQLHRTAANEHFTFWQEMEKETYFEIENMSSIDNHKHYKTLLLLKKYGVESIWAYFIPDTKIIVFACSKTWRKLGDENIYIGDDLSKMQSTMGFLYSYRLVHAKK